MNFVDSLVPLRRFMTHNGALAFLVVPHRNRKGPTSDSDADIEKTSLYTAKRSNRFEPIVYFPNRAREISRAEDNGTNKSFFNSGSWIEYHDRQFDTFIYIDRDGSVLLQWDNVENSVRELAAL
ncbi:MAG: hypothetical protein WCB79_09455 [Halobacteriota archaeon]